MTVRDDMLPRLVELFDGRLVRWAVPPEATADFDGRERTLEVFDADPREQLELLRRLRPLRAELESALGGPLVVVFHTRGESERLYSHVLAAHRRLSALAAHLHRELPEVVTSLGERLTIELAGRRAYAHWARGGFVLRLADVSEPHLQLADVARAGSGVHLLLSIGDLSDGGDIPLAAPAALSSTERRVEIGASLSPRVEH